MKWCWPSPQSSESAVYAIITLLSVTGEWWFGSLSGDHLWRENDTLLDFPTTKRKEIKNLQILGESMVSQPRLTSARASTEYFSFTSALHRQSYVPPWGEFAYQTPFIFSAVLLGFLNTSFDFQYNNSSFFHGFWHLCYLGSSPNFSFRISTCYDLPFILGLLSSHIKFSINPWALQPICLLIHC